MGRWADRNTKKTGGIGTRGQWALGGDGNHALSGVLRVCPLFISVQLLFQPFTAKNFEVRAAAALRVHPGDGGEDHLGERHGLPPQLFPLQEPEEILHKTLL